MSEFYPDFTVLHTAARRLGEKRVGGVGISRTLVAILDAAAVTWLQSFQATQSPSAGVDCPPGIHYRDPDAAARAASRHVRREIELARAILALPQ